MKNNKGVKSRMKLQKDNVPQDISFHYTPEELVKYCLSNINFDNNDFVMDAGAGENKVWLNNIPTKNKVWTEIDLGKDFLNYKENVDWVVGNPPYKGCWEFWQKSFKIARKGVGFLISINMFNKFTPKRLEEIKKQGFYINKIVVVNCKKWFGRYFFVIFTRFSNNFIEWSLENYGGTNFTKSSADDFPYQESLINVKREIPAEISPKIPSGNPIV